MFTANLAFANGYFFLINVRGLDYPISYERKGAQCRDREIQMSMISENEEMLMLAPQGAEQPTHHLLFKFEKSNSKLIKKTSKGLKTWGGECIKTPF